MAVLVKATSKRRGGHPRQPHAVALKNFMVVKSNFPAGHKHHLPKLDQEVANVKQLTGPDTTTIVEQADYAGLRQNLRRYGGIKGCHLAVHGDANAYCTDALGGTAGCAMLYTVGLVKKNGSLDGVDPQDLVELFAPYSVANGGDLEFIFINGCKSDGYGMSLNQMGFVVVCWSTLLLDSAAKLFATSFYEARANGNSYQDAFDIAYKTVDSSDKFEIRDPDAMAAPATTKWAAGIPKLLL